MKDCPENTALGNFMLEMNLNQLITTPTRITDTSESLIDVIITSTSHLVNESSVMVITISDHLPVYTVPYMKPPKPPPQYILTRSYKDYRTAKGSPPNLHQDLKSLFPSFRIQMSIPNSTSSATSFLQLWLSMLQSE